MAILKRALAGQRLGHGYLFDGPPGVGKASAALGVGLALVCEQEPLVGCGRCTACTRALAGNHPDVFRFDAKELPELAKASSEKSAVKYAARQVFPYAMSAPHEAPYRLLVLDNADTLSVDVQNTLLKTLEEPRADVHIVLVTRARDRLLPTILSRTQRIRFVPVAANILLELAAGRGLDTRRAETAAVLAGGSVARFLELSRTESEGEVDAEWATVKTLRQAARAGVASEVFATAAGIGDKESKGQLPELLTLLAALYRDALARAVGADDLVLLGEHHAEIEALARTSQQGANPRELRRGLEAIWEAKTALESNLNSVTVVERLLFALRTAERGAA